MHLCISSFIHSFIQFPSGFEFSGFICLFCLFFLFMWIVCIVVISMRIELSKCEIQTIQFKSHPHRIFKTIHLNFLHCAKRMHKLSCDWKKKGKTKFIPTNCVNKVYTLLVVQNYLQCGELFAKIKQEHNSKLVWTVFNLKKK